MTRTLEATFDGTSLHFHEALDLAPNTVVLVTIETADTDPVDDFLSVCLAANLDGPADWSENLEEYLYERKPHVTE